MHFDITLRELFRRPPKRLLGKLFGAKRFRVLATDFPATKQRTPDLLLLIGDRELLHIELQAWPDAAMPDRMYEYRGLIRQRYPGYRIRQAVLYVGEGPMKMADGIEEPPDLMFRYRVVNVREVDAEFLLASDPIEERLLAILGHTNDARRVIEALVASIWDLPATEARNRLVQVLVLSGLRGLRPAVEEEIQRMPVRVSVFDVPIIGKMAEEAIARGMEQGIARGMEQGMERGRQEGLQQGVKQGVKQGQHEAAARTLTLLITKKFGKLPAWADTKIRKASDRQLTAWSVALLDAPTLKELLK